MNTAEPKRPASDIDNDVRETLREREARYEQDKKVARPSDDVFKTYPQIVPRQ